MPGREQRQFKRIPEAFNVKCRPAGTLSEVWRQVVTIDFSAGGIGFESEQAYDIGERLEIQMNIPSFRTPLIVGGSVVRSKTTPWSTCECAAQFADVTPDQQFKLDELVAFLTKPL
jgi:hypothetical protein